MINLLSTSSQMALILRTLRKKKKLTQKEAAARIGLLPKTVSLLENNPEKCTIGSLFKLLSVLDLELLIQDKPEELKETTGNKW